ncbi:MAG: competence type IV pilus major pilin ComGC [Fimbriimonadales bacterium]
MWREMLKRSRARGYTLIEILIVVMIIGILLAIAVPSMFNASERARANACRANLRQIQAAKEQWALVNRRPGTATPSWANLVPQFLQRQPQCPSGGTYTLRNVRTRPTCSIGGSHSY